MLMMAAGCYCAVDKAVGAGEDAGFGGDVIEGALENVIIFDFLNSSGHKFSIRSLVLVAIPHPLNSLAPWDAGYIVTGPAGMLDFWMVAGCQVVLIKTCLELVVVWTV